MELQQNLENILNKTNIFINIDGNRQKYTNHAENLKNKIFKELRENKIFSYFFNGFQMGGSYGDNVKVSKPDEFDMVFHIKLPERSLIDVEKDPDLPGNVLLNFTKVIKKIERERQHEENLRYLKQWLDDNNYLKVNSLQGFIEACFVKVLSNMKYRIDFNGNTATLRYSRQGPAHTVYVTELVNLKYSIDFVPGILLKEDQSIIPIKGQWEAIPRPSKKNITSYNSFRASYYRQEQEIIRDKQSLKNVFRMMKKFRDAKTNMNKMKSYFIKTLFLHKSSKEPPSYWKKPLQEIVIDMFKELEESLRKETLPFYWDKELNLYDEYNSRLIREMLNCVEKSRETLEKAAIQITAALQDRVYRLFLDSNELDTLRKNVATNGDPSILTNNPKSIANGQVQPKNHPVDAGKTQAFNNQDRSKETSSCIIA